eukprot:Pgem_evm1s18989
MIKNPSEKLPYSVLMFETIQSHFLVHLILCCFNILSIESNHCRDQHTGNIIEQSLQKIKNPADYVMFSSIESNHCWDQFTGNKIEQKSLQKIIKPADCGMLLGGKNY